MMFTRFCKYLLSHLYDEYDGQSIYTETEISKMRPEEALAKALPIAEAAGWLVNRNGTIVKPRETPELTELWRNGKLVWRVEFYYTHILGSELCGFNCETLGYILIGDENGAFIKMEERSRFHKDSINNSMTELDAIEFAHQFARSQNWEWHKPATAQTFEDFWTIRTDTTFADAGIYLKFNEKTKKILDKTYRAREEKGAQMIREEVWEIAQAAAREKEWMFIEPICADFQNGIWHIYSQPVKDYSASVRINDATKKVIEIVFWSGLGGKSLHETYEENQ